MSQQTDRGVNSTTKRLHNMRFGTTVKSDGTVLFRLWAPSCSGIQLLLFNNIDDDNDNKDRNNNNNDETMTPMEAMGDGWFSATVAAKPGMLYKFVTGDGLAVPDPASRYQPEDVHGRSQIIDPTSFKWTDTDWRGLPWSETVLYELHVGTFTSEGTFAALSDKLDYLKEIGITAVELMPIADFPGKFGWGYDGVLPYAPESSYGTPDQLKMLIQQAHHKGMQVFLDVVYNHFGPEGNYLHAYAGEFFTDKHKTPWGAALNFEGRSEVREFFIENALYWLEEYNIDGLRLDAVHAIKDNSSRHVLTELARRVTAGPGRERARHLVLENDDNIARFLERDKSRQPVLYAAQWNDDIHHAYHVLATGETGGYYADYLGNEIGKDTLSLLGRALAEGFIYQNNASALRDGELRGEKSAHLPPTAFVSFIQNHDQIGNRAFGDRIASISNSEMLMALNAIQLLAPAIPLIFMGEEWAATTPFMYFCDLGPELAPLVTEGRRNEFAKFPEFSNPETRHKIPDPCSPETFGSSKLVWSDLEQTNHRSHLELVQSLLKLRREKLIPLIAKITSARASVDHNVLHVEWNAGKETILELFANLSKDTQTLKHSRQMESTRTILYESTIHLLTHLVNGSMPPYSVLWLMDNQGDLN
ncbi:MAG: malto-oligosyltrehalose trehalohydrolase [Cyanobacteria bacterium SZAS LIN-5]|nr:malto-oligosyltrehalose trehalohydrolase [Cyanobacteria bacterium SZAS LIN-5]